MVRLKLSETANSIGLKINSKKTKIITLNSLKTPAVCIGNEPIEEVEDFSYLGSNVSDNNGTSKEIKSRIQKARTVFCQLNNLWRQNKLSYKTKLSIYNSNVKSVLLYGAESWRLIKEDEQKLSAFHNSCLRKICRIFWPNKISNIELYKKTSECNIILEIKRRWRWIGHVLRKDRT